MDYFRELLANGQNHIAPVTVCLLGLIRAILLQRQKRQLSNRVLIAMSLLLFGFGGPWAWDVWVNANVRTGGPPLFPAGLDLILQAIFSVACAMGLVLLAWAELFGQNLLPSDAVGVNNARAQ